MATQIVSSVRTVSFPSQKAQISQAELTGIIGLRNTITALKANLENAEAEVKAGLESGAEVESGVHVASLKETLRRNVAWREICERLAARLYNGKGAAYCENVLQNTHPNRAVTLVVS